MNLSVAAFILPWLLMGFACWLGYQLVRQNGRILLRIGAIEDHLDQMAEAHAGGHPSSNGHRPLSESKIGRNGLPAGTLAPDFRLPRVDGGEVSLSDFRGKKVLLVFSDPHCGPCDGLAPDLEKAHRPSPPGPLSQSWERGSQGIQVVMVSRGEIGENRKKAKQYKLTFPILLQRKWEISKLYAMFATPAGYLIDEAGVIAEEVAIGGEAILAMLSGAPAKELVAAG